MPAQPVSLVTGLKPVNPSIPCFKESDKKKAQLSILALMVYIF